jgi:tetratricopeptide (TPR) repeat protein
LELSSIEREDVTIPVNTNNRRNAPKSSCIECLRLNHDINQQYGEYLAFGDHDESLRSIVETHARKWNDAVMEEVITMGSNEYTIRMQPLNTMRAYHMQDAFDLLKEKSFVRKRVRVLGASEATLAHIRDIDELLRLIDKHDPLAEPVDEQDGVLGAFEQLKKYCIHVSNELTKCNAEDETGDNTVTTASLDKTTLSKIRDVGKALHLMGTSLGGYGFFDQEMQYYNESLGLKELCARNKLDHISISDTLHCMGFSMDNAGRSEEALEFYDRALDIRYEQLGDDDLRVAETLHNKVSSVA